jgi:hypothetical protein
MAATIEGAPSPADSPTLWSPFPPIGRRSRWHFTRLRNSRRNIAAALLWRFTVLGIERPCPRPATMSALCRSMHRVNRPARTRCLPTASPGKTIPLRTPATRDSVPAAWRSLRTAPSISPRPRKAGFGGLFTPESPTLFLPYSPNRGTRQRVRPRRDIGQPKAARAVERRGKQFPLNAWSLPRPPPPNRARRSAVRA